MSTAKGKTQKAVVRYQYPADAVNAADALDAVYFFGAKFSADVRNAIYTASVSMTMDEASQIEFAISDPNFAQLATGIYLTGIPVKYEDMWLEVATVATQSESGSEALDIKCRPRAIRNLKNRIGARVLRNASPSEFVMAECRAAGVTCVVQPSPKRKQVARDRTKKADLDESNSWTTFQRLAGELNFVVFESMGVVYFAKPTWLLDKYKSSALPVVWSKAAANDETCPVTVPSCTRSEDRKQVVDISFDLNWRYGRKFRPGMVVSLNGIPTFNGLYLVRTVDFSLLSMDKVSITCGTPVNPGTQVTKATSGKRSHKSGTGTNGSYKTSSLRTLLQKVGFKGDGLEIAVAVVMAESGGKAAAIGDVNLEDSKWGPSVGLFQIRSLKNPNSYNGNDKLRDATKLRGALYNAQTGFKISNGGKSWNAWSTYTSGAYKQFYKKEKNYQVQGWSSTVAGSSGNSGSKGSNNSSGGKTGPSGNGSASSFVSEALKQVGDTYRYGAEASIKDPNPNAFDCSELVQWAAGRVGVYIPDGSAAQIGYCQKISVADAIRTRGALLYKPGHIAISLGNGRTVEALNPAYGVTTMSATERSFKWSAGGRIPKMRY